MKRLGLKVVTTKNSMDTSSSISSFCIVIGAIILGVGGIGSGLVKSMLGLRKFSSVYAVYGSFCVFNLY